MANFMEKLKATGKVNFKLFDKEGNLKEEHNINNLVVTTGLQYIAARMAESGRPAQMSHMAIGEGTGTPALGDLGLGSEAGRVALSVAGGTPSGTTITYAATFAAGTGTGAITEAGVFNDDGTPAGDMLCRTTFLVINKGADDSLAVTWEVTIS